MESIASGQQSNLELPAISLLCGHCFTRFQKLIPMTLPVPSSTDLKNLLSNGWWALKLIWSTNASLTVGLVMSTLARGMVPAGLAVFARGLINVFVGESGVAGVGMDAVLPWFFLGFGCHDPGGA